MEIKSTVYREACGGVSKEVLGLFGVGEGSRVCAGTGIRMSQSGSKDTSSGIADNHTTTDNHRYCCRYR